MKIHSVGAELLLAYKHTEGQTANGQDMTKMTVTIHNSANSLKIVTVSNSSESYMPAPSQI